MSRIDTALRYFNEQKEYTDLRVKSDIETYRKHEMQLNFRSKSGKLPEEITVRAEQKNHEFKFGANIFMLDEFECAEKNRIYREKFPECFNLATLPFYWSDLEPERGKIRFSKNSPKIYRRPAVDLCLEYCREKGIEPKCHVLNYEAFTPEWLKNASVQEMKNALEERFRSIAEHCADSIPSFEVTNETLRQGFSKFFYEDDFLEWSYRMADRYFPKNRLIINDYNYWLPELYNNRNLYYMQIERLLKNGITHLDSIGLQFHSFFKSEQEPLQAAVRYNPEKLFKITDLYAKFGLAEQITEMTLPAYGSGAEDEYVQSEILRNIYSIFFSRPAMEAVIYWNLVDGYAAFAPVGDMTKGENYYYGGLLNHDMSEKPAYKTLKQLINEEWHTDATVAAKNGTAKFRGFCGDYKITVTADGKNYERNLLLSKKANCTYTIELD